MRGCRRNAGLLLGLGMVSLSIAAVHQWLPFQLSSYLLGVLVGVGIGGLFGALMLWLMPGDLNDSAPRALIRRYYREFFPPMFAYVVVMLGWHRLLQLVPPGWPRVLVALLPAGLLLLVIRAVARYVRDSDELQRRIELEAIAIATGLVCGAYMTGGFLQAAQLIDVPAAAAMLWVFPALCATYGITKGLTARRYQ
ncbi:hypothetical protein [Xanthomonas maliensis]|uniref:hypothetical protein n=1 Tax=Xanthomonas maliensis TaxID=1321368 RepID=UPI0003AADCBE|nr:hypothetical protein [Xanthomonas maliensis]KAB7764225.1 hypothetical protein CKY51_18010 [Xanthomonas maliensis]